MKQMTATNFILTGATGILGSHILYELMLAVHNNDYRGRIVIILRAGKGMSCMARIAALFSEAIIPDYLKAVDVERIRDAHMQLVEMDLTALDRQALCQQLGGEKYVLIHCAASVNLGTNAQAFEEIRHNNYLGTLNLINALQEHLTKVSYVSSAFSLSSKSGVIVERHTDRHAGDFRNHYEQFKVQTEAEVKQICDAYGLSWQIMRPSIICGRLVDYPYHVIPKFLVFYLFGAFFYRARHNYGDQRVRIMMNNTSGLNMIPVDYAAKAIVRAIDTDIKELNIVSKKSIPNTYTVPEMLRLVGWHNYEFQEEMPEDQNMVERLYYKTVGAQLSNYLTTPEAPDCSFDTSLLDKLMHDVGAPRIKDNYLELCSYAIDRQFNSVLN